MLGYSSHVRARVRSARLGVAGVVISALLPVVAYAQRLPPVPPLPPKPAPPAVEKLADGTFRIGALRIDRVKRELTAPGRINNVTILEFVANTLNGVKAYESAVTIDCDAVTFNTALLLLGLNPSDAKVPTRHFDPTPPDGDPVEIFIDATIRPDPKSPDQEQKRLRIEELLFDQRTNTTMSSGPWVYTGSSFIADENGRRYMADLDGVLIGFVHSPSPIIENPRPGAVDSYGSVVLNPNLGLVADSPVTLTIRAVKTAGGRK